MPTLEHILRDRYTRLLQLKYSFSKKPVEAGVMHDKSRKNHKLAVMVGFLLSMLMLATVTTAADKGDLVSLSNPLKVVVNSSYISPLVEL